MEDAKRTEHMQTIYERIVVANQAGKTLSNLVLGNSFQPDEKSDCQLFKPSSAQWRRPSCRSRTTTIIAPEYANKKSEQLRAGPRVGGFAIPNTKSADNIL